MYILKIDLPTGMAYFTGKKRVVQGCESPGLTDIISEAKLFEDESEATKYCKMLIKRYDMEFYYSVLDDEAAEDYEEEFVLELTENLEQQVQEETNAMGQTEGE